MNRKVFRVVGNIDLRKINLTDRNVAEHTKDRSERIAKVNELIVTERAIIIDAYEVDTEHDNGHEIHVVYNNGCIRIYNKASRKHITDLIGRKPQIERYGIKITKTMGKKINDHIRKGYNKI